MVGFLAALMAGSIFAPVQESSADSQLLLAAQATGGSVSITTSGNINLSMETSSAGTVRTVADEVKVTAGNAGYQLYVSTSGDSNALTLSGGEETIAAGGGETLAAPAVLADNTWGFAVAATDATSGSGSEDVVSTGFDASYPVGDSSVATSKFMKMPVRGNDAMVAKRTGAGTEISTKFYYGARVTTAKPSGLYTNSITYTVIGNASTEGLATVSPTSTNDINGGVTITIATPSVATLASLGTITATVGGETCTDAAASKNESYVNVTCKTPSLASGWHEVAVSFEGTGESYVVNPGIEYVVDEGGASGGGASLATTFQTFDSDTCDVLKQLNGTITLTDERDQKSYGVAYFPDGHCWMTQNLRLGNANTAITLKSTDSDVSSDYTIAASAIVNSGSTSWSGTVDAQHIYVQSDTSYGNLYNWFTATAGTGTSSMKSTSATNTTDATSSICPKGWKLPKGGNTGDYSFQNLVTKGSITASTITQTPYSFTYAGRYSSGLNDQGSNGYYWSRSAYTSAGNAYSLRFNSSNVDPQNNYNKYRGFSVRCVYSG